MEKNEGTIDRVVRIVIGAVIAILTYMYLELGILAVIGYLIAAILLVTGMTGFCTLYKLLGISTN